MTSRQHSCGCAKVCAGASAGLVILIWVNDLFCAYAMHACLQCSRFVHSGVKAGISILPQLYMPQYICKRVQTYVAMFTGQRCLPDVAVAGTGGEFGNSVIMNIGPSTDGVYQNSCGSESRTQTLPSSGKPNYLWLSKNNIISGPGNQYAFTDGCSALAPTATAISSDPGLKLMPADVDVDSVFMDPRPKDGSIVFSSVDSVPSDDFFESVAYKGAFDQGSGFWLSGLSWLDANARIPVDEDSTFLCDNITSDTTWSKATAYSLGCQVYVNVGATLTIEAGTTIKAYRTDLNGNAPSLIIKPGAKIMASGTEFDPITFTSAASESNFPARGLWGGVIIMGRAPVFGGTQEVEGIVGQMYGGSDVADNSGVLQYVRVWYGGAVIGANNEINGITFAGVGSGTVVDHCEVAFNQDDGIELFGGMAFSVTFRILGMHPSVLHYSDELCLKGFVAVESHFTVSLFAF